MNMIDDSTLQIQKEINLQEELIVRKDMDVNEYDILSSIINRSKLN